MEIKKKSKEINFQPRRIEILIENVEELEALKSMCWYTRSIPEVVTNDSDKSAILKNFLEKLIEPLIN